MRDAITMANNSGGDDAIVFAGGVTGTIQLASELPKLRTNIDLQGPGADVVTVLRQTGGAYRIFTVDTDNNAAVGPVVKISGLAIAGGDVLTRPPPAGYGGGIYNNGTLTVESCTFTGNFAEYGGAIYSGPVINVDTTTLTVSGCLFDGNRATWRGGAIVTEGGNSYPESSALTVTGSTFTSNVAQKEGGGAISIEAANGSVVEATIAGCTFSGNQALDPSIGIGGAILSRAFRGDTVGGSSTSSTQVSDSIFSGNQAIRGGALYNSFTTDYGGLAEFSVSRSTFQNNSAQIEGGAAMNVASTPLNDESTATLALKNCTLGGNSAPQGAAFRNSASGGGDANLNVTACTLHNNVASNAANGGISNNAISGGISKVRLGGNILATTSGANIANSQFGDIISLGYNLSTDTGSGFLTGPADQINTAPKLDPLGLQNHGGPTPTIALMQGPAVDKSKNLDALLTDQRGNGYPRSYDSPFFNNAVPGGDGTDIGALEAPPDVLQTGDPQYNVNTLADHDDGNCGIMDCTLREAINRANAISGANTILFLVGGTIILNETLGPLTVTGPTTLAGFGTRAMTISGGNSTAVFHFSGGPSFLSGLTIRDGRSSAFLPTPVGGAGLFNTGTLTVNICAFVNNQAAAGAGGSDGEAGGLAQGAGVYNASGGVLTFNRCTLAGNSATGGRGANSIGDFVFGGAGGAAEGGGLYNSSGATLTLSLCTLSGNAATGGVGGDNNTPNGLGGNGGAAEAAGVFNRGTLNLRASSVARNTGLGGAGGLASAPANNGAPGLGRGGVTQNSGTAIVRNSIIALNSGNAGPDVAGAFTSQGYNIIGIGDTASGFNALGDQVGTSAAPRDPLLGPLQDNGGPSDTLALFEFSPAIDMGNSFGLTSDQRGQPRPSDHPFFPNAPDGDGADIGAFEFGAVLLVNTLDDHNDGACDPFDCSLREAINAANAEVGDQFIKFVPTLQGIIQLNSPLPTISATAFLEGPGADRVTVRRTTGGDYRIFTISNGTSNGPFVSLRGLTIANGKVGSETVLEPGGGIFVDRGILGLQDCAIVGNQANSHGAGVFITERSTSELSNIENCTFSGNTTSGGGGGGLCLTSAAARVANCTFSGNSAVNGGAMFSGLGASQAPHELAVESSTLSGNNATNVGGGISKTSDGRVFVTNSIFNNNGGGSLHSFGGQAPISQGYNLSSDAGGGYLTAAGDMVNTDPMLGPLASNGGPTQTHALLPGSPAIDTGFPEFGPPGDQRGFPRVGRQDIGAFEFNSFALRITSITRLANGHILLQGKGVVDATLSIHASPELSPANFSVIGQAGSDSFGNWQFEDNGATGLTRRFYKASFP